jgi:hypothetical protein
MLVSCWLPIKLCPTYAVVYLGNFTRLLLSDSLSGIRREKTLFGRLSGGGIGKLPTPLSFTGLSMHLG